MAYVCIFLVFLLTQKVASAVQVYQFQGNPYTAGPLETLHIELTEILDSSPAHLTVYFPTLSASYVPIVFVPGLYGVIYAEWYSDVFKQIASHGYIVAGVDLDYPALSQLVAGEPEKMIKVINWLVINLNQNVITLHGFPNVRANWSLLGLAGHSAGCDTVLKVIESNNTLVKAVAFVEPFSYFFTKPLSYSLPSLSYGTEYSEQFPQCIYRGFDYRHFYKMLQCPKIMLNVTGFGHCDILNDYAWGICHDLHFCKTVKDNNRVFYHTFIAGYMSGFFGNYLQANNKMLPYITKKDNIPVELGEFSHC